jgi:hypothetical protein
MGFFGVVAACFGVQMSGWESDNLQTYENTYTAIHTPFVVRIFIVIYFIIKLELNMQHFVIYAKLVMFGYLITVS